MKLDNSLNLFAINDIIPSKRFLSSIEIMYSILQRWNSKINLTRNSSPDSFLLENIIDPYLAFGSFFDFLKSGSVSQSLDSDHQKQISSYKYIDVGCGGGFVGVVLKLLLGNDAHVTMIDRNRRKVNFCKETCRALGLKNIIVKQDDFSSYLSRTRDENCILVSRATFCFDSFLALSRPHLNKISFIASFESVSSVSAIKDYIIPPQSSDPFPSKTCLRTKNMHPLFYTLKPKLAQRLLLVFEPPKSN